MQLSYYDQQKKSQTLEKEIKYHDNQYWVLNDPKITDPEYDEKVELLRELNPYSVVLKKVNAATQRGRKKVKHADGEMLSLDKEYTKDGILIWAGKNARSEE